MKSWGRLIPRAGVQESCGFGKHVKLVSLPLACLGANQGINSLPASCNKEVVGISTRLEQLPLCRILPRRKVAETDA